MPVIKRLAMFLWERSVETFATLLIAAIKSLWYAPIFYGINWLVSRHGPSLEMWYGFFVGAALFTSVSKKTKGGMNKEQLQRPVSPIILPASRWEK